MVTVAGDPIVMIGSPVEAYTAFVTFLSRETHLDMALFQILPWLAIAAAVAVRYAPSVSKVKTWAGVTLAVAVSLWVLNSFNILLTMMNGAESARELGIDPYDSLLLQSGFFYILLISSWIAVSITISLTLLLPRKQNKPTTGDTEANL